jgi:hypothetical protein
VDGQVVRPFPHSLILIYNKDLAMTDLTLFGFDSQNNVFQSVSDGDRAICGGALSTPGLISFQYLTGLTQSLSAGVPLDTVVGSLFQVTAYASGRPKFVSAWECVDLNASLPPGAIAGDVTGAAGGYLYVLRNGDNYYKFELIGALNVFAFGAAGNGTPAGTGSDDTAAAQAAIDCAGIRANNFSSPPAIYNTPGYEVYFASGHIYKIVGQLTVPQSYMALCLSSDSSRGAILQTTESNQTMLVMGDPDSQTEVVPSLRGVKVTNIHFQCLSDTNGTVCIEANRLVEIDISNCVFQGFYESIRCQAGSQFWIRGCVFTQPASRSTVKARSHIYLQGDMAGAGGGLHITDCEIFGSTLSDVQQSCIRARTVDGIYINNCHFNNYNYGLWIDPVGSGNNDFLTDWRVCNSYFDGDGAQVYNIYIAGAVSTERPIYQHLNFINTLFRGGGHAVNCVRVEIEDLDTFAADGNIVKNISFVSCIFKQAAQQAIRILGPGAGFAPCEVSVTGSCYFDDNNFVGTEQYTAIYADCASLKVDGCTVGPDRNAAATLIFYEAPSSLSTTAPNDRAFVCTNNNFHRSNCTELPVTFGAMPLNNAVVSDNLFPGQSLRYEQSVNRTTSNANSVTIMQRVVAPDTCGHMRVTATGVEPGTSTPEYASFVIEGTYLRGNTGNAAFVGGGPVTLTSEQSTSAPSVSIGFPSDNLLRVSVTGVADTTMRWTAHVEITAV